MKKKIKLNKKILLKKITNKKRDHVILHLSQLSQCMTFLTGCKNNIQN